MILILFSILWVYGQPATLATIKDKSISESSGLVASRTSPGAYWTHNDSGDGPFIYAFDTRGDSLGIFRVNSAQARDWEDIAAGPGPKLNGWYFSFGDFGVTDSPATEFVAIPVPK